MKIIRYIAFALTGWIVGVIAILVIGAVWPSIFPAIIQNGHYYGAGPSLSAIIIMAILFATPAALVGGIIGSVIPKEGGKQEQYIMAGIISILLALPFSCLCLWFFTGW